MAQQMKDSGLRVSRKPIRRRRSKVRREQEMNVVGHIRTVIRAIQAHSAWVERQCGVSAAQLWALWEIQTEPGLRVKDISDRLSIQPATASNLLDKLQGKGLIRRERCGPDQRVVQLFPTAAGEALLLEAPGPAEGALLNALAQLSAGEVETLGAALGVLVDRMQTQPASSAVPAPAGPDKAAR